MFATNWEELSRRLAAVVARHLAPGKEFSGVVHAHQAKLFGGDGSFALSRSVTHPNPEALHKVPPEP